MLPRLITSQKEWASSSSLHSTSATMNTAGPSPFEGDAAAAICAHLIAKEGLPLGRIAHNLGLPSLVVEECVRNGESSPALRAQLGQWLQENNRVAAAVPAFLVRVLHETCAGDEMAQQQRARRQSHTAASPSASPSPAAADDDDGSLFNALDPLSRQHFTALRDSVGQSFMSILNDPGESSEGAAWGGWLGGKLYEAFDYHGRTATGGGHLEESLRLLHARQQQNPESSASLLLQHPPRTDFSNYVRTVAAAYNTNRKESRELRETAFLDKKTRPEDLPWPSSVPAEFFQTNHSTRGEVESLPAPLPSAESLDTVLPTTTTGNAADDLSALASIKIVGPTTFRRDFEALEERNKELRGWEAEVETCLLQHVQSRSEDFFLASREFTSLSEEGNAAMQQARAARTGGIAKGSESLNDLLGIGALYRRQQNFVVLQAFLGRAITVFRQLQEIDNWTSLPEREMAELPAVVRRLLELEAFVQRSRHASGEVKAAAHTGDSDGEPTSPHSPLDSWRRMSRLKLMRDVPQRATVARRNLVSLVREEVVSCLSQDLSDGTAVPRAVRALEAAALLGVLEDALLTLQSTLVRAQWSSVQEAIVAFLVSNNALDDARADELLSHSTASADKAEPSKEEKMALLAFTNDCRYPVFMRLMSQLIDGLAQDVAHTTQNWGFAVTECLPQALSMYGEDHSTEQMRKASNNILGAVCTHAESIVALLLDVRGTSKFTTNASEVENMARHAFRFIPQALSPVRELSSLTGLSLMWLSSPAGEAIGVAQPESTTSARNPIHMGKYVEAAVHRLAKRHLKVQHTQQMEKLQMVVESETWTPKEDVDPVFQRHVEEMCKANAEAVVEFDTKCVETVNPSSPWEHSRGAGPGAGNHTRRKRAAAGANHHSEGSASGHPNGDTADDTDADLLNAKANKLYLSLDGEGDGRVVGNSLLILVELLYDYVDFLGKFPSLAFDVVSKAYELLALYDSLCAGMVLGARATEKGTLKSITTTHLCVASQCAAFLGDFIPQLQQHFLAILRVEAVDGEAHKSNRGVSGGYVSSSTRKLLPFIKNDLGRVRKDCCSHRDDFFHKMTTLVLSKVDSLGVMEANGSWTAQGNEWVMTMLREAARLIRTLRPLLPSVDLRGVIVPLLGALAVKIREVARRVPASAADARAMATSDVLLFKLNVERFGFDVLRCASTTSVSAAMAAEDLSPTSTDEQALAWFFAPSAQPQLQQQQWANAKKP